MNIPMGNPISRQTSEGGGGLPRWEGPARRKRAIRSSADRSVASGGHVGRGAVVVFTGGRDTRETKEEDCRE